MEGTIFDIKEFSIHDGPGGRITVFFKGCPMRCRWCHNPEGLSLDPQAVYKKSLCTHCGMCKLPCIHDECKKWGKCMLVCPNGALSIAGKTISSDALAEKLIKCKDILNATGGGVTVSGGEPLMQGEFVCELFDKLRDIHKAIETSGFAESDIYRKVVEKADYIMQDIKFANPELHKCYTGCDNKIILENIAYLKRSGKKFVFRVPLIPNITDTEENLTAISQIVGDYPVELLRYNPFAGAKYESIGKEYTLGEIKNRDEDFTKYFTKAIIE